MRIVETDNYDGDYPGERFLPIPDVTLDQAKAIADAINAACCRNESRRYWRVVSNDYKLQPGFEP